MIDGYNSHRRDRVNRRGGGILVYVRDTLKVRRRPDLESKEIECVVVEMTACSGNTYIFFCCYRPPDQPTDVFFDTLSAAISLAESESTILTVLGDFNAKHSSWDPDSNPNPSGARLYQMLLDFSLTQLVTAPTRASSDGRSFSTIDLLCTTRPDIVQDVKVSDPISDHCCVSAYFQDVTAERSPRSSKSSLHLPNFSAVDWGNVSTALHNSNLLEAIQGTTDIDIAWQTWKSIVTTVLSRHIPMRVIVLRPKNKSWMTSELYKMSKKKQRLFRAALRSRSPDDWTAYKTFRNKCTDSYRKAKENFFSLQISKLQGFDDGSQRWWQLAKDLTRLTRKKYSIPDLDDNGVLISTDEGRANLLARFFAKQCSGPGNDSEGYTYGAPFPLPASQPIFDFQPIPESLTLKKLQHLSITKATADPFLSNRTLRECAKSLCSSLTYLFNLSLSTNDFPDEWKQAIVTPLYKQRGSKNDPSNYRPISLLPAVGKVLDSIASDRLLDFLHKNKIITEHQHGFLPGKSTVTQLIYIVEKWIKAMDSKECTIAIFMDFMKAFDRVWHTGLLHKLLRYGVSCNSVAWFASYLAQRSITVRVGNTLSRPHSLTAGVPQGSHLGPILFLVFINDLPESVGIPTELFADDALLHQHYLPANLAGNGQIQSSITAAEEWASSWHGKFSNSKTKIMCLSGKSFSTLPDPLIGPFYIDGAAISVTESHCHLGLTISSSLNWSDHLQKIILTCSRKSGMLKWMLYSLPSDVITKLYLKFVLPSFEYAAPVWHGAISEREAMKLESIQCSVARSILKMRWDTPKNKVLQTIGWPSLRWRREISSLVLFYKLVNSRPHPFHECLPKFSKDVVDRGHRKPYQLVLCRVKSSRHLNSFFIRSSILWNTLPHKLQSAPSPKTFRCLLEEHWRYFKFCSNSNIPIALT